MTGGRRVSVAPTRTALGMSSSKRRARSARRTSRWWRTTRASQSTATGCFAEFDRLASEAGAAGTRVALEADAIVRYRADDRSGGRPRDRGGNPHGGLVVDAYHTVRGGTPYSALADILPLDNVFIVELSDGDEQVVGSFLEGENNQRRMPGRGCSTYLRSSSRCTSSDTGPMGRRGALRGIPAAARTRRPRSVLPQRHARHRRSRADPRGEAHRSRRFQFCIVIDGSSACDVDHVPHPSARPAAAHRRTGAETTRTGQSSRAW